MNIRVFVMAAALSTAPGFLYGQVDLHLAGRDLQVHGFLSEGFAYSNANNYLTMDTTSGSFFTEGGLNVSTQITDKFRVGAQVYVRDIGHFGQWAPELDWAMGDYKFKSWFGVRAGKVKTTFGLYNDSQDMEFLQTWALLPQSIYAVDQRSSYIAHTGGDLYGSVSPKRMGTFSYVVWAGGNPNDLNGGYAYALSTIGVNYKTYGGRSEGADLRWATPLSGVTVGASYMKRDVVGDGTWAFYGTVAPVHEESNKEYLQQFYAQYDHGKFHADAEYRRYFRGILVNYSLPVTDDTRSWYASAAYRVHKRLELGSYYSHFVDVRPYTGLPSTDPGSYVHDKVVSARVDINRHAYFKLEGHFMSGYAEYALVRGFYGPDNPNGFSRLTNMLVLRTGFNF
ncbi:MAG TPA: hypothetical protein VLY24_05135 [Bryobacteraceae bacterium]|nr:hypothetical protein [Bryobacteraceae bacterium]